MNMKSILAGLAVGFAVILGSFAVGTTANAQERTTCYSFFDAAAEFLGGPCEAPTEFNRANPVGVDTVRDVDVKTTVDKKRRSFKKNRYGFRKAVRYYKGLKSQGYDVRAFVKGKRIVVKGKKVDVEKIYSLRKVRGDAGGGGFSGTADNSNGMRGRDVDTGDGGNDRF